jgi:chromosomal replication initiation ATPase DnaA
MNYAPERRISTARHIARTAQQQIKDKTGMQIDLLLCSNGSLVKTPEKMLRVVAIALSMSPECFKLKTRLRNIAELRFLGAIFLRMHFPMLTLHQIAALFGGQDHTSIMSGIARANNLIYTGDLRFIQKYNLVLNSVNLWLRREVSVYA